MKQSSVEGEQECLRRDDNSYSNQRRRRRLSFQFTQSYFFFFFLFNCNCRRQCSEQKKIIKMRERNKIPKWIKIYFIFCTLLLSRTIVNYYRHDILHYFFISFFFLFHVVATVHNHYFMDDDGLLYFIARDLYFLNSHFTLIIIIITIL